MKQAFKMKTMFFAALLCAVVFGAKAQIADATNPSSCDIIFRFQAVDAATCTVVAVDPGPYFLPAGSFLATFIGVAWTPAAPTAPYIIVAEVADAACGFPG